MIKSNDDSTEVNNSDSITETTSTETTKNTAVFKVNDEIIVEPTGFRDYGVFCKCEHDYTGLIHISRITTKFVKNVADYFTIGQKFKAKIIEVHEKTKKLSLSTKEYDLEAKKLQS